MMNLKADKEISRGLADLLRRTHQLDLCKSLEVMVRTTGNHFDRFAQRYASIVTWEERKAAFGKLAAYDVASAYAPDVPGDVDAATANLYGAAVHLYSVEIASYEGNLDLRIGGHRKLVGEDGARIYAILSGAESAARRILALERALLAAPFVDELGVTGINFSQSIPDTSYSSEPHWKELGFRRFFRGTARALRRALETLYIPATDVSIDASMFGELVEREFHELHLLNLRLLNAEVTLRARVDEDAKAPTVDRPELVSRSHDNNE